MAWQCLVIRRYPIRPPDSASPGLARVVCEALAGIVPATEEKFMGKWKWIERRAREVAAYFNVSLTEAYASASEDWDWMRVVR
jgi:hypothetical protein